MVRARVRLWVQQSKDLTNRTTSPYLAPKNKIGPVRGRGWAGAPHLRRRRRSLRASLTLGSRSGPAHELEPKAASKPRQSCAHRGLKQARNRAEMFPISPEFTTPSRQSLRAPNLKSHLLLDESSEVPHQRQAA